MGTIKELTTPALDEYKPYYERYVALVKNKNILELLDVQTVFIKSYFEKLDENRARKSYGLGKWTFKEVLGHLIDTEKIFHFRALCIARDEKTSLPGFDQNKYVEAADFNDMDKALLIQSFELNRLSWTSFIHSLKDSDWKKTGIVDGYSLSVRAIAYIVAGHMEHHIHLLTEKYDALP